MPAPKVAKAMHLATGVDRGRNNSLQPAAHLRFKRLDQRVPGLADGNDKHAAIGVEVVEVITNPKNSALAVDMAGKRFRDRHFAQGVLEDFAGGVAHGWVGHRREGISSRSDLTTETQRKNLVIG